MKVKYPLQGIRVVDFSWRATGPIAARMLAWYGAEVIRIESFTRLCGMRQLPPFTPGGEGLNIGGFFNNCNSSKLAVTLNLSKPKGVEIAKKLIAKSDVVVENFSAGAMENMGLGYDELVKVKPDIIMVSHSIMGLSGPWKEVSGHGPNIQAMSGLDYIMGYPDRPPIGTGVAITDYIVNPHHSALAVLAALHYRQRTGRGQYIDLAQYESVINATGTAILEYTTNRRCQERIGNRIPHAAPHGVYRCRGNDRWCVISVFQDAEWEALCRVMGQPQLARETRFATLLARKENEDELDRVVEQWTVELTAEEVMLSLQQAGVAAGVVQNAEDLVMRDPQMRARSHYRKVHHVEAGERLYDGPPFILSANPIEVKPAPMLGEHNEYVYGEILGMTEEEITECYVEGIFE